MQNKLMKAISASHSAKRVVYIVSLYIAIAIIIGGMVYIEGTVFDGVRTYVRGEGLWAKAQKDSIHFLDRYTYTHSEKDYISFTNAMKVIDGDRMAKLALRESPPDREKAKIGFMEGNNDSEDIPTMIDFFLRFRNISYMKKAISIWDDADNYIKELKDTAKELKNEINSTSIDRNHVSILNKKIWVLNKKLYEQEYQFSNILSIGARWIKATTWYSTATIFLLTIGIGLWISRRLINQIFHFEKQLLSSESRYKSLSNSNIIGIAYINMDGVIMDANRAFIRMLGLNHAVINSGHIKWESIIPDYLSDKGEHIYKELENNGWCKPYEIKLLHVDAHTIPVMLGASMVNGEDDLAILFTLNLTERYNAEEKFQKFFSMTQDLACIATIDGHFIDVNDRWQENLGYTQNELLATPFFRLIHPDDIDSSVREMEKLGQGISTQNFINRLRCKNGEYKWLEWCTTPSGNILYASARDITQQKFLVEKAEKTQYFLQMQIDRMPIGHIVWNSDLIIQTWNPAATEIFGYSENEMVGEHLYDSIFHNTNEQGARATLNHMISDNSDSHNIYENITKEGNIILCEWTNTTLQENDGNMVTTLSMVQEITERVKNEETIWKQANFDDLTGLPNRQMFYNHLYEEASRIRGSDNMLAVMLIDLDRFKEINDTLGHASGDILLVEAARRISNCVRKGDMVSRLGGDEFIVIISDVNDPCIVDRIAQNIIDKLSCPFGIALGESYITGSIGIALYPNDTKELSDLLSNADQAMYSSKNSGRNRFSYFTIDMQKEAINRLDLANEIRDALEKDYFQLYFQPIVDLSSGNICKVEALLRWEHPSRGMISPAEFIPVAEETGLINSMGDYVFMESVKTIAALHNDYNINIQISINKSPVQFLQQDSSNWMKYLNEYNVPGSAVSIEITEGLLLHADENVSTTLSKYRNNGIQIAIDDFGTGYSSLAYLKKFNVDYIKIDQSFIRNLGTDESDNALCEAIIVMAHKLGFKVIAEGVETLEQKDMLLSYGCDFAQGYLISRPLPFAQLVNLLENKQLKSG